MDKRLRGAGRPGYSMPPSQLQNALDRPERCALLYSGAESGWPWRFCGLCILPARLRGVWPRRVFVATRWVVGKSPGQESRRMAIAARAAGRKNGRELVKRLLVLAVAGLLFVPGLFAQEINDHVNVGVFGNYVRLNDGAANLAGVGARLSFNILPVVQLEAESSYEFDRAFTSGFNNGVSGSASIGRTNVRMLDGLFGPKIMTNKGPVRLFLTAKGGFDNFLVSNAPVTFGTVGNSFENLHGSNVYGVFYPGGGAEAFWGPIGLRFDIGDEMYFQNGGHNNLRIAFGPTIRF